MTLELVVPDKNDRALAAFPSKIAVRTQYALLGVMVLFTMSGLLILSGG